MCEVEYEPNDFESTTYHTARKPHRCCECDEVIVPGQRYRLDAAKWDKQISTYKTCLPCENLRHWLTWQMQHGKADENGYVDDCNSYLFEHLSDGVKEAFDHRPPPHPPAFLDGHLRMFFEAHFDDVFTGAA